MSKDNKIVACAIVDVEEEFDWTQSLSFKNTSVSAVLRLGDAQEIFDRYGFVPTYLMTYPVAVSEEGRRAISPIVESRKCVIGAQLHPWNTPPVIESHSAELSYPGNLPVEVEEEKLANLTQAIRDNFGHQPKTYKAGRYGLRLSRYKNLVKYGYKVDTSIMPSSSYAEQDSGPDFFDFPDEPFWLNRDEKLLSIPSTQTVVGPLSRYLAPSALRQLFSEFSGRIFVPALLSRLGLLERLRLSPEGSTLEDMKKLVDWKIANGQTFFCLSFHSPSLAVGHTPYVRTESDLTIFKRRLDGILNYLVNDIGAAPHSTLEIYEKYSAKLQETTPLKAGEARLSNEINTAEASRPLVTDIRTKGAGRKILFVSGFFPPLAPMGAVRTQKLVEHWTEQGYDVRVIAAKWKLAQQTETPQNDSVYYLPYTEPGEQITRIYQAVKGVREKLRSTANGNDQTGIVANAEPPDSQNASSIKGILRELVVFPDRYKHWTGGAVKLALSWRNEWMPDLIYSSGPPHSSHIVASKLQRKLRAHWIAELRDLWASNPYNERHPFVEPIYDSYAKNTLRYAEKFVVVTNQSSIYLEALTRKAATLSYNGFDPKEFDSISDTQAYDPEKLTILHAGVIYPGQRDPTPLFEAIVSLGDLSRKIRCLFYHDANGEVAKLTESMRLTDVVEIRDAIPRPEMLTLERKVDILLECRRIDEAGDGVIPGKLFEYIGANRPILSIGSETGEAADIVRKNNFGLASTDPMEIASMLKKALEEKAKSGRLADLDSPLAENYVRALQFEKIDKIIEELI